ncbi:hypothetical protein KL942_001585 [Ogataea angusta]|uniref:Altered inheritance of mitochondria protein 6 n=1 Tax=Pichia angusta TaxID=870730 RepID=A0AAN6DGA6_PICAN|nr:uncharacterized protein KL928_002623 [Ogataea angusta]KAG7818755.1 hypothetical protein KL928_002623 [Ogataea angusta]KAG7825001.1 hypothetical protein KL909_001293 [Ogataea angusta]KAG7830188.1 hypothetical protein KL920_001826 [Ogataea angusta]KAG7834680.1 hypothetical protein KL943_003064 [Ogataea angusta]KAG7841706.1 hypothetical protein KL942_001585 [Ogataea angusta]
MFIFVLLLGSIVSCAPIAQVPLVRPALTTELTRDVFVKQIHSHNDYWREYPCLTALSLGVQSIEADVWVFPELNDSTMYVGHNRASLTPDRTLENLYLNPILSLIDAFNPVKDATKEAGTFNGVFDTDSGATLYLFVDMKTDGLATWSYVYNALEPLRKKNYLTTYNSTDGTWKQGPLTVIGTGNTPFDEVQKLAARDVFFDGVLGGLHDSFTASISPIASSSLEALVGRVDSIDGLNSSQTLRLSQAISDAHAKGIYTRIWDTPWWPVEKQTNVWRQILQAGSDFLNADDLEYAIHFQ